MFFFNSIQFNSGLIPYRNIHTQCCNNYKETMVVNQIQGGGWKFTLIGSSERDTNYEPELYENDLRKLSWISSQI